MRNRRIVLASRPSGVPVPSNFTLVEQEVATLKEGELLTENLIFAIDPAVRGMLDEKEDSYLPAVPLGGIIPTMVLGRVIESRNPNFKAGDYARGFIGWEEHSVIAADNFAMENVHVDPSVPLTAYMGALGWSGITAYVGLERIGEMKAGNTVVVSAAAGAVGSVAGQIARLRGCRAVGIASTDKVAEVTGLLGMHAAVDYKTVPDLSAAIREACEGKGADVYFDNVGGDILDTMMPLMADFGRIVVCGMVADYNQGKDVHAFRNLWQILVHRVTMRGFLAYEHLDMLEEAEDTLTTWVKSGQLKATENVATGIESAPDAFIRLMSGQTKGKTIVRLKDNISTLEDLEPA
ncbi:NADP-dependent oxidoreductase [Sphingobium sp.]|uniref:NADP-dependent oxidoreductase n=1 Tax=Sphingobium sp. TaxID=1912891 RepID=UPI002CEBE699|nr:NADP-dependent oxidoreductase [Sphingobium sp.]HUD89966.1 NADP-dependent oxidoreductase [Sphingobium sp.]